MELEDETEMLVAEIAQFLGAEAAYIDAINHDAATIRLVEGTDNLEKCSLTGTTRTDDTYHLALVLKTFTSCSNFPSFNRVLTIFPPAKPIVEISKFSSLISIA